MVVAGQQPAHWSGKGRTLDLYDIVGDVLALSSGAVTQAVTDPVPMFTANVVAVSCAGVHIGYAGQVEPAVATACGLEGQAVAAVIDLRSMPTARRRYAPVSAFPSAERDLAFVVSSDLNAGDLVDLALAHGVPHIRSAEVFDVYHDKALGQQRKSLALRMAFGSMERTLVDADVDAAIEAIRAEAGKRFGAVLRGSEQPLAEQTSAHPST